jgi:adenylate cyclase
LSDRKYDLAYKYYKRTIEINPNFAEAHHGIAIAMMYLQGDANIIYNHLSTALALKPELGLAHSHMAVFLDSVGKTQIALEHARIAIELMPNDVEAKHNYQMMLKKLQEMR